MEYIYGAMLLHSAGQEINEEKLKKLLTAAGIKPDEARIKALVASLEGVNIEEVIKSAAQMPVATAAAPAPTEKRKEEAPAEKKEKKEKEVSEEEAAAGLGALFG